MRAMYINGEFTQGSATEEIEVTNPATEEVLDTVPRGTGEDVDAAVRSSVGEPARVADGDAVRLQGAFGAHARIVLAI